MTVIEYWEWAFIDENKTARQVNPIYLLRAFRDTKVMPHSCDGRKSGIFLIFTGSLHHHLLRLSQREAIWLKLFE